MYYDIDNMKLNFIKRLFGWSEHHVFPSECCVIVFLHTSYWDMFTYILYRISSYGENICVLVQPKLSKWYYKPLTCFCNCIFAPPNENKNSNSIENIVKETKKMNESPTLHRPERKMRQNAVMTYIFYNYVSSSLLNVPL